MAQIPRMIFEVGEGGEEVEGRYFVEGEEGGVNSSEVYDERSEERGRLWS